MKKKDIRSEFSGFVMHTFFGCHKGRVNPFNIACDEIELKENFKEAVEAVEAVERNVLYEQYPLHGYQLKEKELNEKIADNCQREQSEWMKTAIMHAIQESKEKRERRIYTLRYDAVAIVIVAIILIVAYLSNK